MAKQTRDGWIRCDRDEPCPICGHMDWCVLAPDRTWACCMREPKGALKEVKNGGFMHRLAADLPRPALRPRRKPQPAPSIIQWTELAARWRAGPGRVRELAAQLGLESGALERLGLCSESGAAIFPMRRADGVIWGLRIRRPDGRKFCYIGSREGLFFDPALRCRGERVFICEGPTDCAALMGLDLKAVGRPSNIGGAQLLREWLYLYQPSAITIIMDRDENKAAQNQTAKGVDILVEIAAKINIMARIIWPPPGIKDVRDCVRLGLTRAELLACERNAKLLGGKGDPKTARHAIPHFARGPGESAAREGHNR